MRETSELPTASIHAPNRHPSFHAQSQRAQRHDAKLAICRIRQIPTQCNTVQQHATKTRARTRELPHPRPSFPRNPPTSFPTIHVIPATTHVIPAKAGIPSLGSGCVQLAADSWSCRPRTAMPIRRTEPRGRLTLSRPWHTLRAACEPPGY